MMIGVIYNFLMIRLIKRMEMIDTYLLFCKASGSGNLLPSSKYSEWQVTETILNRQKKLHSYYWNQPLSF
jgi:hypothetical protein